MVIDELPLVIRRLYKGVLWRKNPNEKKIYLTFDDGPIPVVTPWVLDQLDRFGVKATFFCVGENVQKHPDIYAEILKRGHRTGNHTFNHVRGFITKTEDYLANIEKAAQYIKSDLFRPPHGDLWHKQYMGVRKSYQIVQWDLITRDYNTKLTGERVFQIVRKHARNGSIIVFHDSVKADKNMRYAMPKSIAFLLSQGFEFDIL
jgi:peptidoglycan-N-acetylglucosamine deacetylase